MDEFTPFEVPGGWSRRLVQLGEQTFDMLLPTDPDYVLESHLENERREGPQAAQDPYWAALWSSCIPTAEMVLEEPWGGDEDAMELGCGAGLVGLAALARGLNVTFSDHEPYAIELALVNARRNGWGHARGEQLDWQAPAADSSRRYHVLLASDVLYHRANHIPLLESIECLLAADGVCWIGDPGRFHSGEFLQAAGKRFRVELLDRQRQSSSATRAGKFQLFVLRR